MNERKTTILGQKVQLLQPEQGFRTGLDAVIVAAAARYVAPGDRVLDMGCGVGGVTFCLLSRVPGCAITGVDLQEAYIELAKQNAELNDVTSYTDFIQGDVLDYNVASSC
jgi:tRNA1(Val) A37 N6-methylase TrmN6